MIFLYWKSDMSQLTINPLPPKWRRKRQLKLSPVCQSDVKNVSWEKIILDAP